MVFAFPWLGGLPLAFLRARGARRGGYCSRVVGSDASRLRCVSCASVVCAIGVSVALAALNFIACGVGWVLGVAGGVFDGSWSAIERCGGGRWRFEGQSDNLGELFCSPHDDVSEHGESSLGAELFAALASRGVRAE